MTWNASLIDGPITIYVYGEPTVVDGDEMRPIIGTVPGYHINIAPQVYTEELSVYVVVPQNPVRTFAGAETVFLKFKDEAEAKSALNAYWIEE